MEKDRQKKTWDSTEIIKHKTANVVKGTMWRLKLLKVYESKFRLRHGGSCVTYAAQEAVGGGVLLGPQRAGVMIDEL